MKIKFEKISKSVLLNDWIAFKKLLTERKECVTIEQLGSRSFFYA